MSSTYEIVLQDVSRSLVLLPAVVVRRNWILPDTLYKYFKRFKLREGLAAGNDCLSVQCRVANESTELVHAVS